MCGLLSESPKRKLCVRYFRRNSYLYLLNWRLGGTQSRLDALGKLRISCHFPEPKHDSPGRVARILVAMPTELSQVDAWSILTKKKKTRSNQENVS
jgi:hypothetical protein